MTLSGISLHSAPCFSWRWDPFNTEFPPARIEEDVPAPFGFSSYAQGQKGSSQGCQRKQKAFIEVDLVGARVDTAKTQ